MIAMIETLIGVGVVLFAIVNGWILVRAWLAWRRYR